MTAAAGRTSSVRLRARSLGGQVLRGCGYVAHHFVQFLVALTVTIVLLIGAVAWRLSEGPIEITALARQLERALSPDPRVRLVIGHAAIAWEGWHGGFDRPLDVRATDVALIDAGGRRVTAIPRAEISLTVTRLLLGEIAPRAIELDGADLTLLRAPDGAVSLDLGTLNQRQSGGSGGGRDWTRWSQMRRLLVRDAQLDVVDRAWNLDWRATEINIDLARDAAGAVIGQGGAALTVGGQSARLSLNATLAPASGGFIPSQSDFEWQITPFNPGEIASGSAALTPLAAVKAAVALSGSAQLDGALRLREATVRATLGPGSVAMGEGALPIRAAQLSARVDASRHLSARLERLDLAPPAPVTAPGTPITHVTGTAEAQPNDGSGYDATVALDLDRVAFADLPALWPQGIGGKGTRPWIVQNVVAGIAHDLHVELALSLPPDLSDPQLRSVKGGLNGSDLTAYWLRPVPPIEHGEAHLTFVDPDTIDIAVLSGRQGGIVVGKGDVRVTKIEEKDQFADIQAQLSGPLADVLTLLSNPKIRLLQRRPIPMQN
ncbi:MAG: hypothetical protein JO326_13730, partial [Acetobacteraceae bacterium]|nr:hypothetical protein [Acetobacteraceae bacterium]